MKKLKGRLFFTTWAVLSWKLVTNDGEIDLYPIVNHLLESLNLCRVERPEQMVDSFELLVNKDSKFTLRYTPMKVLCLEYLSEDTALDVQISAEMRIMLSRLSGRLVDLEIEDGRRMRIAPDISELVLHVSYACGSNGCEIPSGASETVCRKGKPDRCIFFNDGECRKFDTQIAHDMLSHFAEGTRFAKGIVGRIGNCALLEKS